MADNYTLFSQVVPALKVKERQWALQLLQTGEHEAAERLSAAGIDVDLELDSWPAFQWELLPSRPVDLWVYSQDCGSPQQVALFVQALLRCFRPRDVWTLTWAETCSRPRTGEFGGGGVIVTADAVRFYSAHEWVSAGVAGHCRAHRRRRGKR